MKKQYAVTLVVIIILVIIGSRAYESRTSGPKSEPKIPDSTDEEMLTYGPYACGNLSFSIEDRFNINALASEPIMTDRWVRLVVNDKEQETTFQAVDGNKYITLTSIVVSKSPDAKSSNYENVYITGGLVDSEELTKNEQTSFVNCFNAKANEVYGDIYNKVSKFGKSLNFVGISQGYMN